MKKLKSRRKGAQRLSQRGRERGEEAIEINPFAQKATTTIFTRGEFTENVWGEGALSNTADGSYLVLEREKMGRIEQPIKATKKVVKTVRSNGEGTMLME